MSLITDCRVQLKCDGTRWRTEKLTNGMGRQYMVYPALLPLMRTPRLPVVEWTDATADLNGLVRFAERRNLVSARVPPHFNWPIPHSLTVYKSWGRCLFRDFLRQHTSVFYMHVFWLEFLFGGLWYVCVCVCVCVCMRDTQCVILLIVAKFLLRCFP